MSRPRLNMSDFCKAVAQVIRALPQPFCAHMHNIAVDVDERPSNHVLREQGLGAAEWRELLGYFEGAPITEQEFGEHHPNRITLFKQSIEAASRSVEEIRYEIRRTILHELAHHFGFSEDDLDGFESMDSPFDDADSFGDDDATDDALTDDSKEER